MTKSKNKKIIIIEDEKSLLKALRIELADSNLEILSALDGESGLALVKREKPDLVLLDILMPRMDGYEVLKFLKTNKSTKNIPVIVLTNLGQEEEKKRCLDLGAQSFYIKASVRLDELAKKINQALA